MSKMVNNNNNTVPISITNKSLDALHINCIICPYYWTTVWIIYLEIFTEEDLWKPKYNYDFSTPIIVWRISNTHFSSNELCSKGSCKYTGLQHLLNGILLLYKPGYHLKASHLYIISSKLWKSPTGFASKARRKTWSGSLLAHGIMKSWCQRDPVTVTILRKCLITINTVTVKIYSRKSSNVHRFRLQLWSWKYLAFSFTRFWHTISWFKSESEFWLEKHSLLYPAPTLQVSKMRSYLLLVQAVRKGTCFQFWPVQDGCLTPSEEIMVRKSPLLSYICTLFCLHCIGKISSMEEEGLKVHCFFYKPWHWLTPCSYLGNYSKSWNVLLFK